jgi:outer membrane lipoprotein-sorting protein
MLRLTKKILFLLSLPLFFSYSTNAQELTAREVVAKADEKYKGELSSEGVMTMTIVRPSWTREMTMKSWSEGDDLALILVTAPARDKGTAFLKREKEIWNWQPTIDRVIKLPPSMMMQSWMGSDFTNDDLVKQSSIVDDYEHSFVGEDTIEGRECWQIEMIPNEDAAVVWGKVMSWIDKQDYMQLKAEFYDEDDYLVNTMYGKDIKEMGGKILPALLEVIPADEDGHKTIVEYKELKFNVSYNKNFFSVQNMKRIR